MTAPTLTAKQLHEKLQTQQVLLIDVREPSEHAAAAIAGSYLIPLSKLTIDTLPSLDKTLVFHCKSGHRSSIACERILQANPTLEAYSLAGGLLAWQAAGYPVESAGLS